MQDTSQLFQLLVSLQNMWGQVAHAPTIPFARPFSLINFFICNWASAGGSPSINKNGQSIGLQDKQVYSLPGLCMGEFMSNAKQLGDSCMHVSAACNFLQLHYCGQLVTPYSALGCWLFTRSVYTISCTMQKNPGRGWLTMQGSPQQNQDTICKSDKWMQNRL